MSASTAPLPHPAPSAAPSLPALGMVGMLASPVFLTQWIASGRTLDGLRTTTAITTLGGMLYLLGWAASAIGMRRARATGAGRGGAVVLALLGVGLVLGFIQQVQDLVGRHPLGETFYGVCDIAWPASHVFMLVVGVAVIRAGVWTGWRRWAPLACGLALPLAFLAAGTLGPNAMAATFAIGTAAAFLALGRAVAGTRVA